MSLGNELRVSGGRDYTQILFNSFGNPCKCTSISKTVSDPQPLGNAYSQAALFMVSNEGVWVKARESVFLGGA